jgi:hypothetical protein
MEENKKSLMQQDTKKQTAEYVKYHVHLRLQAHPET